MIKAVSIRSLFEGYPGKDANPSVREAALATPQIESPRTPQEDVVHAMMPGDDINKHPRFIFNPYMRESYSVLKSLVKARTLSPEAQKMAQEALYLMQRS